jgi:hypothetical protein
MLSLKQSKAPKKHRTGIPKTILLREQHGKNKTD